jgi:hypothetical protein
MSAIETVREWLENGDALPEESDSFFKMWVIINACYNEWYTVGDERRNEWRRVLHFGRDFNGAFRNLPIEHIKKFVIPECIGEGKLSEPPSKYVREASQTLKEKLGLRYECELCRPEKKSRCANDNIISYPFVEFEALMKILYQVRCNLFHGDKLESDEYQEERNKDLIKSGNIVLRDILNEVCRRGVPLQQSLALTVNTRV